MDKKLYKSQGDRKLCPFPRCVVRSGDMRLKP